jgi:uncharacterized protein (DUF1501 family)
MNRRTFIKNVALASAATLTPDFLHSAAPYLSPEGARGKVLVVIQLAGGNDGLNTLVPFRNDEYYLQRPNLSLSKSEIIPLSDDYALNIRLSALRNLYDEGFMSVYQNVGYPNPDRSHFRSLDIWNTASNSDEYFQSGWLGRYIDHTCVGCTKPHMAIELDDALSLALKGERVQGLAVSRPDRMGKAMSGELMSDLMKAGPADADELSYLYKTLSDAGRSVEYLVSQAKKGKVQTVFPSTNFGNDLKMIATLVNSGCETSVYYVSLSGFDTHNNQKNRQAKLLLEYADGLAAFYKELKTSGHWKDTLVLTFSEFGRRVQQNASQGTDHGKANCLFLAGGGLKNPGLFNTEIDLTNLDEGDLPYKTDFREIYSSVLSQWLHADAEKILQRPFKEIIL